MKFDMASCGGCRTCELACSFHHCGGFVPAISSMKVLEKDEGRGYLVLLKEEPDGNSPACDDCEGLDIPLCLEYCREMDDLYKILQEFKVKRPKKNGAVQREGVRHGG